MREITARLRLLAIDSTRRAFDAVSRRLDGIDRQARRVDAAFGRAAAGFALVGAGIGATKAVTAAADFESALTNIQKKAGASAAETAKLGEEIKALATSGELAVPIEEIAAAYERGAAAGIPLDELRQFAALSAKAADAFEMSATDVGNAAAGFNTVLKIPMAEMERYFDLINGLADSGIADESGIVAFIDQAGSMAKTFGLSAEQTAALGAALANLKVPSAKAATAINSILTKILAPNNLSGDAREAFGELVGDVGAFTKLLEEDADGALLDVLKRLKSLDKVARTGIIYELFGQDHLDVVSQMVEGTEEIERNMRYAAGQDWFGSLDKSYQLKLDDFWSQWQLMKNSISELAIDLGTMGMPAMKEGLEGARALVEEIGEGLKLFEARVDWDDVDEAKAAVDELIAGLGSLMGVDTSGGQHIKTFFRDISNIINDVATGVKETKEFVDWMDARIEAAKKAAGIEEVLEGQKQPWTDRKIGPDAAQLTVKEGGIADTWLDAFGRTIDRITGQPVRGSDTDDRAIEWISRHPGLFSSMEMDQTTQPISPPVVDIRKIDRDLDYTIKGQPQGAIDGGGGLEPTDDPKGWTAGELPESGPIPKSRPDDLRAALEQSNASLAAALTAPDPILLSPPSVEEISGPIDVTVTNLADLGNIPLPTWRPGTSAPDREGRLGRDYAGNIDDGPVNRGTPAPTPRSEAAGPIVSGPPDFTPGRGVTYGGPGAEERFDTGGMTVEGVDELRAALEAGSQSVAQGGRDAQVAIDQSGAQLPAQGRAAGSAFAVSAGAEMVAQARAWGAAMAQGFNANVRTPSAPSSSGGQLATGNRGRTMPNAGTPASGAAGARS